jgi:hypothetical protein
MGESRRNPPINTSLYDRDFYLWIEKTVQDLQARRFQAIDLENLIEEIESMGRSERRELQSRLMILIEHLLKLKYWINEKSNNQQGWSHTVIEQRKQIQLVLRNSPSLTGLLPEFWLMAYQDGRELVLAKSELTPDAIPDRPPFSLEDALDTQYWP